MTISNKEADIPDAPVAPSTGSMPEQRFRWSVSFVFYMIFIAIFCLDVLRGSGVGKAFVALILSIFIFREFGSPGTRASRLGNIILLGLLAVAAYQVLNPWGGLKVSLPVVLALLALASWGVLSLRKADDLRPSQEQQAPPVSSSSERPARFGLKKRTAIIILVVAELGMAGFILGAVKMSGFPVTPFWGALVGLSVGSAIFVGLRKINRRAWKQ